MKGFSGFVTVRTKPDIIIHGMESHLAINISEYRAAAMYSEPEVLVFPKQLKKLTTLKYVKIEKE
jgi:hypothetical protein